MSHSDIKSKGIHIKLTAENHLHFKVRLMHHGVSMQDAFEEFARLVGSDNATANNIVARIVRERIKQQLASAGLSSTNGLTRFRRIDPSELSSDVLYDLINEADEKADEAV